MKKIAIALAILVLAAAAFFGFRYYQAAQRLRSISAGGEYRALGFKLILSAPSGGVKGWIRLQPYLEIPEVSLDASEWGGAIPLPLGKGRLKTGLWDKAGLRLVLDAGNAAGGEVEFDRLAFELALPDRLLSMSAKELRFPSRTAEPRESLSLQEAWLQMRPGEGKIPAQVLFRFQGLTFENRSPQSPMERVQVGATEVGYALDAAASDWKWRIHFNGQGLAVQGPEVHGDVRPWNFVAEGVAAKWDESTYARWRELWAALPEWPMGKIAAWPATVSQLRPRLDRLDFRWRGLDFKEREKWYVQLEPLDFAAQYLASEGGHGWKLSGQAQALNAGGLQRRLELRQMSFSESVDYRGLTYEAWLNLAVRYYGEIYASRAPPSETQPDFARFYLPYIAQMPDRLTGELAVKRIVWQAPDYRTEHRDFKFSFGSNEKGLAYRIASRFDSQASADFPPKVEDGKIELDFGFPLPYRELIAAARSRHSESGPSEGFFDPFRAKEAGLDWKWRMDLGPEAFALNVDLSALAQLGDWIALFESLSESERKRRTPSLPPASLGSARAALQLKVERLSKLQAFLEKIKSGASMALGLAGAYVVVDPKADTLSLDLKLESGKVFLNGRRNESLESMLKAK